MDNPDREYEDSVEEFAAKALRTPKRLSAEDLIASELAVSILSDPLAKIRHVCEALTLLSDDELKQADVPKKELEDMEKIYAIGCAIQNAYVHRLDDKFGRTFEISAAIPWPFDRSESEAYLGWAKSAKVEFYSSNDVEVKKWMAEINALNDLEKLYEVTSRQMTITSYRMCVTRFIRFAMPRATAIMKKLICLISPDSYSQALQILRGGPRGKTKA